MNPALLIFDCDGVLVDSEILSIRGMVSVLNAAGIPATYAMIAQYYGMKQADILVKVAEETGMDVPADFAERIWPATRTLFQSDLKPMAGLAEFLGRHPNIPRCVASSSSLERIRFSLGITGLLPLFGEDTFSSSQVARGKPAPDLFLFAAGRMGIAPERCIVIEDSKFGVRGARAAGMTAIGFAGGSHIQPHHAEALSEAGAALVAPDWPAVEAAIFGNASAASA